jgi:hypothetical protein
MEQLIARSGECLLLLLPRLGETAVFALLLCMTGLPFLAVTAQNLAVSRGRGAYEKCAGQLGRFARTLGIAGSIAGFALLVPRAASMPGMGEIAAAAAGAGENPASVLMSALTAGEWLCVLLSTFFAALYTGLWRALRESPMLHRLLGLSAGIYACAALYAELLRGCGESVRPAEGGSFDPAAFLFPDSDAFRAAALYLILLAPALAGGYGALWLAARRRLEDYGRDHYNLALPWCAAWARNSWLPLWLLLLARSVLRFLEHAALTGGRFDAALFVPDVLVLGIFLAPGLWWIGIVRSANPMRAKIAVFLAPLVASAFIPVLQSGLR